MPVKLNGEMEERIKKASKILGISYVEICKTLFEIGLNCLEKNGFCTIEKPIPEFPRYTNPLPGE